MAELIAGMASSHAYAFLLPDKWDERREKSRARYVGKYGEDPPVVPELEQETLERNLVRFKPLRDGLDRFRTLFDTLRPDALLVIGDDQSENYRTTVPQFSIFTGQRVLSHDSESATSLEAQCDTELASYLLQHSIDAGFDVSFSTSFPEDRLISHAHAQILTWLRPTIPIVLIFVNSFTPPAPAPARCYEFGRALRDGLEAFPGRRRVLAYGSGGLSHFSAGYPYEAGDVRYRMGAICEAFDRQALDWIQSGRGDRLKTLTSRDLIENGAIEYRQWITLLGLLGERKPEWLEYGAFYRGIMGMSVAYWQLNGDSASS